MLYLLKRYPISLFLGIAIWVVCLIPIVENPIPSLQLTDKWVHMMMYLTFTLTIWMESVRHQHRYRWSHLLLFGMALPIIMGGLVEIVQATCTGGKRNGDWLDFCANAIGVCIAVILALTYYLITTRCKDESATKHSKNGGHK